MPKLVEARGLSKSYEQKQAVRAVDLMVEPGEWVALLGPNGCGKSTLLGLLGGWLRKTSGTLTVLGADLSKPMPSDARAKMGVAFQTESLDPLLTVRENLELHEATSAAEQGAARRAIEQHELGSIESQRVGKLSGGWARRVDLARAALPRPDLLLIDEPTAGLDPRARASWLQFMLAERDRNPNGSVIMTTHLLEEAEPADRVVLMDEGAILADDSPENLVGGERFVLESEAGEKEETGRDGLSNACAIFGDRAGPFSVRRRSLDDVFLERTGKALRNKEHA